uniref:Uncharacterized protein n=2 Tax=Dunaliella tertiolecta TaxID=3047 RepID=A0A7S3R0V0_DUNTE
MLLLRLQVFGKEVAQRLISLHTESPHLLLSLEVWVPAPLAARLVEAGLATSSSLAGIAAAPGLAASAGSWRNIGSPGDASAEANSSDAGRSATPSEFNIRPSSAAMRSSHSATSATASTVSSVGAQSGIDLGGLSGKQPGPESGTMEGRKGDLLVWVHIGMRAMLDDAGKGELANALGAAARAVPQGRVLGAVSLYAAPAHPGASYMPLKQHITFQHHHISPALKPNQAMTFAARDGSRPSSARSSKDRDAYWGRDVYQRVFLSDFHASTWASWNRDRGDPAQPFHQEHMIAEGAREVDTLISKGQVLQAHKVALVCAVAAQDGSGIYQLSRCCLSTAQELSVLLSMNRALAELMGEDHQDAVVRAKFDTERLRRLVLLYCNGMRRAMSSPRSCYFTGLLSIVPAMLAELADTALSEFTFDASHLAALDQLAVWTKACEVSVAAALHDCIDDDVAVRWLGRPKGNSSGGGSGGSNRRGVSAADGAAGRDHGSSGGSVVLRPGSAIRKGSVSGLATSAHPSASQQPYRHTSASGGVVRRRLSGHRPSASRGSVRGGDGAVDGVAVTMGGEQASKEGAHHKWQGGVAGAVKLGSGSTLDPGIRSIWGEGD